MGTGFTDAPVLASEASGFLYWAVQRGHLKPIFSPPCSPSRGAESQAHWLSPQRCANPGVVRHLPAGEVHDRWRFAIQLCSVYGLRPEELRYLVIKDGVSGQNSGPTDRKSMGGTKGAKTEPRMLHPLLLRDPDGTAIDWNLQARLQEGE